MVSGYRKRITLPYAPQVAEGAPAPARVAGFSVQSPLRLARLRIVKLCRDHRPQAAYAAMVGTLSLASINVFVKRWPVDSRVRRAILCR